MAASITADTLRVLLDENVGYVMYSNTLHEEMVPDIRLFTCENRVRSLGHPLKMSHLTASYSSCNSGATGQTGIAEDDMDERRDKVVQNIDGQFGGLSELRVA